MLFWNWISEQNILGSGMSFTFVPFSICHHADFMEEITLLREGLGYVVLERSVGKC
jgi:hypothetical protein